jgi:hypothetical protein
MEGNEGERRKATPFDALVKAYFDDFSEHIIQFIFGFPELTSCRSVGEEFEIPRRITDRVYQVTLSAPVGGYAQLLIHIEVESSYRSGIGPRMGMYRWGLYQRMGVPVVQVVWYVTGRPPGWPEGSWKRENAYRMPDVFGAELWNRWHEVWLPGGYSLERLLGEGPAFLAPFAALMKEVREIDVRALYEQLWSAPYDEELRKDLVGMAFHFLSRVYAPEEVMEMLRLG